MTGLLLVSACLAAPAGDPPDAPVAHPAELLVARVDIDKPIDKAPLKDVLEFLTDKFHLRFLVNAKAFSDEGTEAVEDKQVSLSKVHQLRLGRVLQAVLTQLDAAYLVRNDHVEITTAKRFAAEVFKGESPSEPAVSAVTADYRTLADALAELAKRSDGNVLVDPKVKAEAHAVESVRLLNVPLSTAVRVLAEQAGLTVVWIDNVLFVTTHDAAARLRKAQPEFQEERNKVPLPQTQTPA